MGKGDGEEMESQDLPSTLFLSMYATNYWQSNFSQI